MDPDPQDSHWTCLNKSSQETNLNCHRSSSNIPSFPSVKGRHQQRQRREKTFTSSKQSLHPALLYPSRRRDLSDPAGPSPKRFHVNTRPANVLSNEPLQDAINAAYYRYLLPPDHTSIEAWIHDTILAQFPDSLQSTKTLPVCEGDKKPSHNKKQQQSLLSTLVPPQSPSLQAHQNAHRALTKIPPNSQKRKRPVHHTSKEVPLFAKDLHRVRKQPALTCLSYPLTRRISQCSAPEAKLTYPKSELIHYSSSLLSQR